MKSWLSRLFNSTPNIRAEFSESPEISRYYETFSGVSGVSGSQALRCGAVLACVRCISEDVSALPINVRQQTATGWRNLPLHPVQQLLGRTGPNPYLTSQELRERMILDSLLHGFFANWTVWSGSKLKAIYPLQPSGLTLAGPFRLSEADVRSGGRELNYLYSGIDFEKRAFTTSDLWMGRLLPADYITSTNLEGRALSLLVREAVGIALRAEEQGARLFRQGTQTDLAIVCQGDLDKEGRDHLKESFSPNRGASRSWLPLVLENGVDIKRIGLTAQESQYLEARQFQVQDIARAFRVPMIKLGQLENVSTYGAAEQQSLEYTKSCIIPWTLRIQETGQRDLLRGDEQDIYLHHDLSHLLKADQQTRYRCWQVGVTTGFLSRNDVRGFEGLPSIPGLDEFLQPTTTVPTDEPETAPQVPVKTKPNAHAVV